jgi:hypothetical protein
MIELKQDLWEWIVENLDDAMARAENRNQTLRKFICSTHMKITLILASLMRIKNFYTN